MALSINANLWQAHARRGLIMETLGRHAEAIVLAREVNADVLVSAGFYLDRALYDRVLREAGEPPTA